MADYAKRASWLCRVASHVENETIADILKTCADQMAAKANDNGIKYKNPALHRHYA